MKNNKMKLAAFVLAALMLVGCGSSSAKTEKSEKENTVVESTDQQAEAAAPAEPETPAKELLELRNARGNVEVPQTWVTAERGAGECMLPKEHGLDMNAAITAGCSPLADFDGAALEDMPELLNEIIPNVVGLTLDITADSFHADSTQTLTINGVDFLRADGIVEGSQDTTFVRVYFRSLDGSDCAMTSYPGFVLFMGKQEGDRALSQEEINGYLEDMEQVMQTFISTGN